MKKLERSGAYEIYRIKYGVAYNGWFLVATATPQGHDRVVIETIFVPLDVPSAKPPGTTPERRAIVASMEVWKHVLTEEVKQRTLDLVDRIEQAEPEKGLYTRRKPEVTTLMERDEHGNLLVEHPLNTEAARKALRNLYMSTLPMPTDHPILKHQRGALATLRRVTSCPALHRDLDSIWPGVIRVEPY